MKGGITAQQISFKFELETSAFSGELFYRYWKSHATRRSSYRIFCCLSQQKIDKVINSLVEYHMNNVQQLKQSKLQSGVAQCLCELNQWYNLLKELQPKVQAMIKQDQLKQSKFKHEKKTKSENKIQTKANGGFFKTIFSSFWRKQNKISINDVQKNEKNYQNAKATSQIIQGFEGSQSGYYTKNENIRLNFSQKNDNIGLLQSLITQKQEN